jgi:magnesium chelatase family protein
MLAQRFANLLPQLNEQEQFEAVKIHSIAGLSVNTLLAGRRPFRNPHHVVSDVGLIGGGSSPRPGEISLAHRGVLFLDEFPEYRRSALEALRTPLETGEVRISRAKASTLLPARFQLLAAMNPCPCGRLGSKQRCICSDSMLQGYLRKLSQPILERIDIQVELEEVSFAEMTDRSTIGDLSDEHLQSKVQQMMELQHMRQGALNCRLEGEILMSSEQLAAQAMKLLEETAKRNLISARSFIRILRIARTIADLDGTAQILDRHVAEAIGFRLLDRRTQRTISGLANS